jgi:MFS family permease
MQQRLAEAANVAPLGRDFRRFWLAASVSNLGDGIRLGAMPLLALRLTSDARLIAAVTAATMAPWFFIAPLAGALVDRQDRRHLMLAGQVGRVLLALLLAVLVLTDDATIWWVLVVALGIGIGEVFVDTSSQAAVPQLVETHQLEAANARLIGSTTALNDVVGVWLGAVLFAAITELPFFVDAATFALSAAVLVTVRRPMQGERRRITRISTDISEGFRFLLAHRLLRRLAGTIATLNLATNISFGVYVIFVIDELGASERTFGLVMGVAAMGGVLGAVVAEKITIRFGRTAVLAITPFAIAATLAVNVFAQHVAVVGATLFATMFLIVASNVPGQSLRQEVTPEHMLGRVVASFRTFGLGAAPIGALLGGVITEEFGVRTANAVASAVACGAALLMLRALRQVSDATNPALP